MCGIAGIVSQDGRPVHGEEIASMCAAMVHRGPDDEGIDLSSGAGLGARRLSIIDLETGHQPVRNEDGTVRAVLNGEIYNFKELREELIRNGHRFATAGDTECIVHLYEEDGPRCVRRMRGMFAFALWDTRRRTLLLARDRLGIKPLYYAEAGGRLAFASELKVLLQLPEVERRLDWGAVHRLFAALTTPSDQSIVRGVRKLEPAHLLTCSPDRGLRIERYWDLRFEPDPDLSEEDAAERLRQLLDESVRLHLRSDVPVGAFLSGGVDSSAVVAAMTRHATRPVKTFSIGFAEEGYDELRHARAVARRFGTEHHELVLEPKLDELLDDLAWYLDEPFGDSSAIPTYMVSKLAAAHVKVALSGDGGDELFAGYDRYLVEERERRRRLPAAARAVLGGIAARMPESMRGRNLLRHLSLDGPDRYLDAAALFDRTEISRLLRGDAHDEVLRSDPWAADRRRLARGGESWLSSLQDFDLRGYLPLDILTKVDRMSMAHGLEARVPLLDHPLVEFAATIPAGFLLKGGAGKQIFKRSLRGVLPDPILDRPKQGFAVPLGSWFRHGAGRCLRDRLLSDASRRRGILDPSRVEELIRRHEAGRPLDLHLWTLLSFEVWCQTFLDARPRAGTGRAIDPGRSLERERRTPELERRAPEMEVCR